MRLRILLLAAAVVLHGCRPQADQPAAAERRAATLDRVAESYVRLVLLAGAHDPDHVESYYGPDSLRPREGAPPVSLPDLRARARALLDTLAATPSTAADPLLRLRGSYLATQLRALVARLDMLAGEPYTFDQTTAALFGVVAPARSDADLDRSLATLDSALPGPGTPAERYERSRRRLRIPRARLDTVFRAAVAECRARTTRYVELPAGESVVIEYVSGGSSAQAFSAFQGNGKSIVQLNTDLPLYADRAVEVACHETYPGHHLWHTLREDRLAKRRGWVEFTIWAYFTPQSLLAEATAVHAVDVAFRGRERREFERTVLLPLAGIDPSAADAFDEIERGRRLATHAVMEIARRYSEGRADSAEAVALLRRYAFFSHIPAATWVNSMRRYPGFSANYTAGREIVARAIEGAGGADDSPDKRWAAFEALLATPVQPADLMSASAPRD